MNLKSALAAGFVKTTSCYAISFEYANCEINALKQLVLNSKDDFNMPDMVEFHAFIPDKNKLYLIFGILFHFLREI